MKQRASTARSGFSLVELMFVATLLVTIAGAVALVAGAHGRAYQTGITAAHLEAQTAFAVERIVGELKTAGAASLVPDPTPGLVTDDLSYVQATDYEDGEVVWTPMRSMAFEYEPGEVDDGLDNNGNGLADEGQVVLTEDLGGPNERRRVLTRWVQELLEGELPNGLDDNGNGLVDETGFVLERFDMVDPDITAETLVVRLSLHRLDAEGRLMTRTAQSSIRIRN